MAGVTYQKKRIVALSEDSVEERFCSIETRPELVFDVRIRAENGTRAAFALICA